MDLIYVGLIGILVFLGLIAIRVPVAYAMALVGTAGLAYINGFKTVFSYIPLQMYSHTSNFSFAALPLFILMGSLGFYADIAKDSYDAALAWFGKVPGGLAITTVYACAIFGACSGSALAECAVFSKIAIPEMVSRGYNKRLALGTVCSAGCLDVLIPPSIPLVLYGVLSETSIGQLLIAGILPGIVYAIIFALAIGLFCYFKPSYAPKAPDVNTSWAARWSSFKRLWAVTVLFVVVLGSIYLGWATPDEAAGVGVIGTFLVVVYRKKFKWHDVLMATLDAGKSSSMIFLILGGASIFSAFLLLTGVFSVLTNWIIAQNFPLWGIFLAFNVLWVVMDVCLDGLSIMILTLPIAMPIMQAHNVDPVWFGIVMWTMLLIGGVSPPFAMNCFVLKGALGDQVDMKDIYMGSIPFCFLMLFILILYYVFPELCTWLPGLMKTHA
jgi:tripartite ATP-independent transporter DctM subunit